MDWKRISSALLGFPLVLLVLVLGNQYIVDIALSIIAMISIHEYFEAVSKKSNPIRWIGYLACLSIAVIHLIPIEYISIIAILAIPMLFLLLFLKVIISKMKTNFNDVVYTFFGIIYIVFFIMMLTQIRDMENGKVLIWYAIFAAWATDIFAYFVGKYFGKHKLSSISPKKTVEGAIGGIIGAVVVMLIYTYGVNYGLGLDYSYINIAIIALILSIISQIGDFIASIIKRYVEIKDYSELIPGHGGMLDRIDSLLFIAPFAYIMLSTML